MARGRTRQGVKQRRTPTRVMKRKQARGIGVGQNGGIFPLLALALPALFLCASFFFG